MSIALRAEPTLVSYLSGTGSDDTVNWEFKVSGGRRSGEWSTIPVPSCWETQGFGTYRYWSDWEGNEAPDKTGWYRHRFEVPEEWQSKTIALVFGGVMTDAEVTLNGQPVGPVHQGGFYEFRYDVTELLRFGAENLLKVKVDRFSTNESVNRAERLADYWMFSGIHRPVWLEVNPTEHIDRVAINARHDGFLAADLELEGIAVQRNLVAQIKTVDGDPVGSPFQVTVEAGQKNARLESEIAGIQPWSAEWPNLYTVELQLRGPDGVIHTIEKPFGFRTVTLLPGVGLFVNDKPVRLRGVNRHTSWPDTGRTTNRSVSELDINLIKGMNMNAVRMSHYPPERHFLETADRLGLYVIDELGGWQAAYDTEVGEKLVAEMIRRDVNHPSIIIWSNGNEGGWNTDLDDDFASYDPQNRTVIHPWANFNGLNTSHYEVYGCCPGWFFGGSALIMPTEFLHGLYDGGGGAGLDDWWKLMIDHPLAVGGFLWAFADEGVVRDDKGGRIDVADNRAPDGMVGPHREKEGSFFAIKEIWSPVYFPFGELDRLPADFPGRFRVENRYDFTNLRDVRFDWELVDFPGPADDSTGHRVTGAGTCVSPDVAPRGVGELAIDLPQSWREHDALLLRATDPHGREIYTWTWMITRPQTLAKQLTPSGEGDVAIEELDNTIVMQAGETTVRISRTNGELMSVEHGGQSFPLRNGPRILSGDATPIAVRHFKDGADQVVACEFEGALQNVEWRLSPSGWLHLNYALKYPRNSETDYQGVTFDFDESGVTGMRWLGKGPYRVWKNRLKGAEFDVWSKAYNDAITGMRWEYPEFKGFHDDMYWAVLEREAGPVTIVFGTDDLFLRVFTPADTINPRNTTVEFPKGDLSILHGIIPIGTKFHPASSHGPAGAANLVRPRGRALDGSVSFYFGDLPEN